MFKVSIPQQTVTIYNFIVKFIEISTIFGLCSKIKQLVTEKN